MYICLRFVPRYFPLPPPMSWRKLRVRRVFGAEISHAVNTFATPTAAQSNMDVTHDEHARYHGKGIIMGGLH